MKLGQMDETTLQLIITKLTTESEDDLFYFENAYSSSYQSDAASCKESTSSGREAAMQAERRYNKTLLLNHNVPYILNANMGLPMPMLVNALNSQDILSTCALLSQEEEDMESDNEQMEDVDSDETKREDERKLMDKEERTFLLKEETKFEHDTSTPGTSPSSEYGGRDRDGNRGTSSASSSSVDSEEKRVGSTRLQQALSGEAQPPKNDSNVSITQYVESTMRIMDHLFSASFYDYLRDESNALHIARHLSTIVTDFSLRRVAVGVRWLVSQWSLENVHIFLRRLTQECK
jgi:hypothetical protein